MTGNVQVALGSGTFRKARLLQQGLLAIVLRMKASANPALRLVDGLGGRAAVAAAFKVSSEAVRLWLKNGIPADRALDVEEATSGTAFAISATEILQHAKRQRAAARASGDPCTPIQASFERTS